MMNYAYLPFFRTGAPSPVYCQFGVTTMEWDETKFDVTAVCYFEAILKCTDTSYRAYARLVNEGDDTVISTINSTSITPERVRSAALSMPAGPVDLRVEFGGEPFRGPFTIYKARLVVELG